MRTFQDFDCKVVSILCEKMKEGIKPKKLLLSKDIYKKVMNLFVCYNLDGKKIKFEEIIEMHDNKKFEYYRGLTVEIMRGKNIFDIK